MDIKQLEAFVSVVDEGSFSRAAKKLRVTQPTISAHIASLESELGCRVVQRLPSDAAMTETGEVLYGYAEKILALRAAALAACRKGASGLGDTIRIAASTIPAQYALPVLTAEFHLKYPLVQFEMVSSDSSTVASDVLSGAADVGFAGAVVEDEGLVYEPFMRDDLVVVTPPAEPYLSMEGEAFGVEALLAAPLIVREPGSGTRMEFEAFLEQQGAGPDKLNVVAQMDGPEAIVKAVSQGLGVSVVSRLSAGDYERFGQIRTFKLEGDGAERMLYLVRRKGAALSAAGEAFVRFIMRKEGV